MLSQPQIERMSVSQMWTIYDGDREKLPKTSALVWHLSTAALLHCIALVDREC